MNGPVPGNGVPILRACNLVKNFGGFRAVNDVSLDLETGAVTALIGPNGAGKTTLFNLITGQLHPDAGTVTLRDQEVTASPPHLMARLGVGRTFQDVRLFGGMSVAENIAVYAQDSKTERLTSSLLRPFRQRQVQRQSRERAWEVMEYLGIGALADSTADSLGFAQQKLVAIARLLALDARLLFLDEPASGLDHNGRETLVETIAKLAGDGFTVCFVEHNTEIVRELANRVVFLAQGRVVAEGPPSEVFDNSSLAEVYFGVK